MSQQRTISNQEELAAAIADLEKRQSALATEVRTQFWVVYEGLRPANLIKNAMNEVRDTPGLAGGMINSSIGIASGMITNKLFVGSSHNPLRKLVGTLLMFGVRKLITENEPMMNAIGKGVLKLINRNDSSKGDKG